MNNNSASAVHYQTAPQSSVSPKIYFIMLGGALLVAVLLFKFLPGV